MSNLVPEKITDIQTLTDLMAWFEDTWFKGTSPFPSHYSQGSGRVLLLTGANATGKSLVFRCLAQIAYDAGLTPITLSIRERTGAGLSGMAGMRKVMIYGDEIEESTGANSAQVVGRGFDNVEKRFDEQKTSNKKGSLLMLDEPDMGLSEGYAAALGTYIGERVLKLPGGTPGVVLVTHSRALAQRLCNVLGETPHFLHMGEKPSLLKDWLASVESFTVSDLLRLEEESRQKHKAFSHWQQSLREPKQKKNPPTP